MSWRTLSCKSTWARNDVSWWHLEVSQPCSLASDPEAPALADPCCSPRLLPPSSRLQTGGCSLLLAGWVAGDPQVSCPGQGC